MGILNIRKVKRAGSKVVIGIAGQSGTGKTFTALLIARGMVDSPEQIGFLDSENKRGSLYADALDGQFLIADLNYPFTPSRYKQAITEFQEAGVKVLVIDTVSHEWEQGCIDIAEEPLLRGMKMANWKLAKSEHKKFMNVLLQSDMHIICSIRAAEKMDFSNPRKPVSLGIQPLCEKNFMFEMTLSFMMANEGMNQYPLKVPQDLKPIFGNGDSYLGVETGVEIIKWINSGEKIDEDLESWKNKLQLSSVDGTESLSKCWSSIPKNIKQKLKDHKEVCKSCAMEVDKLYNTNERVGEAPEMSQGQISSDDDFTPPAPKEEKKETKVSQPKKQDNQEINYHNGQRESQIFKE